MHQGYEGRVDFLTVYIKEAHPLDEWQMGTNVEEDVCYRQPRQFDDRLAIARDFISRFSFPIPLLIDGIDNRVMNLYSGWPERFYIIDPMGIIRYKGVPGPFGYHPEEVEAWLRENVGESTLSETTSEAPTA